MRKFEKKRHDIREKQDIRQFRGYPEILENHDLQKDGTYEKNRGYRGVVEKHEIREQRDMILYGFHMI